MQARETTIKELIQGERQFRVPLFQRPYTWKRDQVSTLWQDILGEYYKLGTPGLNHFIGSFVLAPIPSPASYPVKLLLVVDGQQRLITLLLALCAVRDAISEADPRAIEKYNDLYLINKWQEGGSKYRLIPTQGDREPFFACIDAKPAKPGASKCAETYAFFASQLQLLDRDGQALDLGRITTAITDRLAIVDITTGANDNVHRIFESLNAKGARLTQGDLIRNYVFMLLPKSQDAVYEKVWHPMEELLGSANLQGFARVEMQREGKEVALPDVYKDFQRRLDPLGGDEMLIEAKVADMARLAPYYKRLIDPSTEPDKAVRSHLEFLATWGAQTSHPLIMFAYDLFDRQLCQLQQVRDVLSYIESFLVRRQLQGIPTNALNWLFVRLIPDLPQNASIADAVRKQLSGKRRYWATDEQIKEAIRTRPFYLTGRGAQQMLILRRLERSYKHPEPVDLDRARLTIEHIMPQTLTPEWRKQLTELGQDPEAVHEELLHTLGNLTLTAYNSPLSNNPFARKKQILQGSNLELNKSLRENDRWGKNEILRRANDLAKRVCKIWVGPLPGVDDDPSGFDWTMINAAIESVPPGRWTSFGDLAALSGTTPAAVGNHLAGLGAPPHGYRVLSAAGKPNHDFSWPTKKAKRKVIDVLKDEGVLLDPAGKAPESTRMRTAELSKLVSVDPDSGSETEPD